MVMDIVDELPDADVLLDVWREAWETYADGEGYDYNNNKRDDERTKMTMEWTL